MNLFCGPNAEDRQTIVDNYVQGNEDCEIIIFKYNYWDFWNRISAKQ